MPSLGATLVALLALIVAALAALLLWAVVTPVRPLGAWQAGTAQMMEPAQRRSLFAAFDPFFRTGATTPQTDAVTSLDLTLFGVRVNQATSGGSAIIAGSDGVQSSFAVGEAVLPGVTLVAVAFDHVILERSGVRETLYLDQSSDVAAADLADQPPAGSPLPPVDTGAETRSGPLTARALAAGVALSPRNEGGKVTGIAVQPQGDGAILRRSGLRPGDIIRGVNGRPVSGAADLAGVIAPGARLTLEVERGAEVVPVAVILE